MFLLVMSKRVTAVLIILPNVYIFNTNNWLPWPEAFDIWYLGCFLMFMISIFTGYQWGDIVPCVRWMAPFAVAVREMGPISVKFFPNIQSEDSHTIQTHVVDMQLLVSRRKLILVKKKYLCEIILRHSLIFLLFVLKWYLWLAYLKKHYL